MDLVKARLTEAKVDGTEPANVADLVAEVADTAAKRMTKQRLLAANTTGH
jgi:hypothetical protein